MPDDSNECVRVDDRCILEIIPLLRFNLPLQEWSNRVQVSYLFSKLDQILALCRVQTVKTLVNLLPIGAPIHGYVLASVVRAVQALIEGHLELRLR